MKKGFAWLVLMTTFVFTSPMAMAADKLNFAELTTPSTFNYFLACPRNFCNKATPNRIVHVYDVNAAQLTEFWQTVLKRQPRISVIKQDPATGYFQYNQSSSILFLPSEVTIQIVPVTDATATFAIYSRSQYGFYDFSSNANRVNEWIGSLDLEIKEYLDKQQQETVPTN